MVTFRSEVEVGSVLGEFSEAWGDTRIILSTYFENVISFVKHHLRSLKVCQHNTMTRSSFCCMYVESPTQKECISFVCAGDEVVRLDTRRIPMDAIDHR